MKFIIYLYPLLLLSCSTNNKVAMNHSNQPTEIINNPEIISEDKKDVPILNLTANIVINFTHHSPYCGGAAPSQEMLNRLNQPMSNTTYNLINLKTLEKTKVKTDSLGELHLDLGIGSYAIQELYKDCSFPDFMKQDNSRIGMYIEDLGPECYKKWWQSYLGEFTVISIDERQQLNMRESESCFTGKNPCLIYTGPYPP